MSILLLWSHLSAQSYLTRTGDVNNTILAKISAQTSRTGAGIALALVNMASSGTNRAVNSSRARAVLETCSV